MRERKESATPKGRTNAGHAVPRTIVPLFRRVGAFSQRRSSGLGSRNPDSSAASQRRGAAWSQGATDGRPLRKYWLGDGSVRNQLTFRPRRRGTCVGSHSAVGGKDCEPRKLTDPRRRERGRGRMRAFGCLVAPDWNARRVAGGEGSWMRGRGRRLGMARPCAEGSGRSDPGV